MENRTVRFSSSELARQVTKKYGAAGRSITVAMRRCKDVPRFIQKMDEAHRQTASSMLHFGPSALHMR